MSDVKMEWDVEDLMKQINQMGKDATKFEGEATLEASKVIKRAVEKNLPRSDVSKAGYIHMKDDVEISELKEDYKRNTRQIKGGKRTWYKWKWLEYGTSKMKGNQFVTRSVKETKVEVKKIIDDHIKKGLGL